MLAYLYIDGKLIVINVMLDLDIRQVAGLRGEAGGPAAGPEQQPGADGFVQPGQLQEGLQLAGAAVHQLGGDLQISDWS